MPVTRLPGLDAVIKMATATAQKHADASPNDLEANSELREAIASTWEDTDRTSWHCRSLAVIPMRREDPVAAMLEAETAVVEGMGGGRI